MTKSAPPGRWAAARAIATRARRIHQALAGDPEAQADIRCTQRKQRLRVWKFRYHPKITAVLDLWWAVPKNSFVDEVTGGPLVELSKEQYKIILRKLAKALVVPEDYDPEAVEEQAEEDWYDDNHGKEVLIEELFKDAMFELCDVWTRDDTPELYAEFLRSLLNDVAGGDPPRFKHDHEISYGGYIADDDWDAMQANVPPPMDFTADLDDGSNDKKGSKSPPKRRNGPDEAALLNDLAIAEGILGKKEEEKEEAAKKQAIQDKKDTQKRKDDARKKASKLRDDELNGKKKTPSPPRAKPPPPPPPPPPVDEALLAAKRAEAEKARDGKWIFTPNSRGTGSRSRSPLADAMRGGDQQFKEDDGLAAWVEGRFGESDYLAGGGQVNRTPTPNSDGNPLGSRRGNRPGTWGSAAASWDSSKSSSKPQTPGIELSWSDFHPSVQARTSSSRDRSPPREAEKSEDELFPPRPDTASSLTSSRGSPTPSSRPTTPELPPQPIPPRQANILPLSHSVPAVPTRPPRTGPPRPLMPKPLPLRPRTDLGGTQNPHLLSGPYCSPEQLLQREGDGFGAWASGDDDDDAREADGAAGGGSPGGGGSGDDGAATSARGRSVTRRRSKRSHRAATAAATSPGSMSAAGSGTSPYTPSARRCNAARALVAAAAREASGAGDDTPIVLGAAAAALALGTSRCAMAVCCRSGVDPTLDSQIACKGGVFPYPCLADGLGSAASQARLAHTASGTAASPRAAAAANTNTTTTAALIRALPPLRNHNNSPASFSEGGCGGGGHSSPGSPALPLPPTPMSGQRASPSLALRRPLATHLTHSKSMSALDSPAYSSPSRMAAPALHYPRTPSLPSTRTSSRRDVRTAPSIRRHPPPSQRAFRVKQAAPLGLMLAILDKPALS